MPMNRFDARIHLPHRTAKSISKLAIGVLSLLVVLAFVAMLPGIERVAAGLPLSFALLAWMVLSVGVAGILVAVAPMAARVGTLALDAPPALHEHLGSLVHWSVILVAIIVAHRGVAPAVEALAPGWVMAVDVLGLLLALPPLLVVALRLYCSIEPLTELTVDRLPTN